MPGAVVTHPLYQFGPRKGQPVMIGDAATPNSWGPWPKYLVRERAVVIAIREGAAGLNFPTYGVTKWVPIENLYSMEFGISAGISRRRKSGASAGP